MPGCGTRAACVRWFGGLVVVRLAWGDATQCVCAWTGVLRAVGCCQCGRPPLSALQPCPPCNATVCCLQPCRSSAAWCSRWPASRRAGTARPGPAPPGGCAVSAGECGVRVGALPLPRPLPAMAGYDHACTNHASQQRGWRCKSSFRGSALLPCCCSAFLTAGVWGSRPANTACPGQMPLEPSTSDDADLTAAPHAPPTRPPASFGCEEMNECPVPMPFTPLGDFIHEVGRRGRGGRALAWQQGSQSRTRGCAAACRRLAASRSHSLPWGRGWPERGPRHLSSQRVGTPPGLPAGRAPRRRSTHTCTACG